MSFSHDQHPGAGPIPTGTPGARQRDTEKWASWEAGNEAPKVRESPAELSAANELPCSCQFLLSPVCRALSKTQKETETHFCFR